MRHVELDGECHDCNIHCGAHISILVPSHFVDPDWRTGPRAKAWHWLEQYWKENLPYVEVVIGEDKDASDDLPFSKSVAVNDAAYKARGDIYVIIDTDAYLPIESVIRCSQEICMARKRGHKLWFIPYRRLYRMTQAASDRIMSSDPANPPRIPSPPPESDYLNKEIFYGTDHVYSKPISGIGHWYGAMAQIMSREAFDEVGGWDPRFRGWGGEDHAAMCAMDTLYSPHKTLLGPIFHLWHPTIDPKMVDPKNTGRHRMWAGQKADHTNDRLSHRYYWANRHPLRMRNLVNEFKDEVPRQPDSPFHSF